MAKAQNEAGHPRYKVGRVIQRYDLDGMGEALEARWLGRDREAESLRDLADVVNKAILRNAMEAAGKVVIDSEVETTYEVLTDDGASGADQTKIRRDLNRDGVDIEQLERDFVTHQAVYTYLTKGREVSKEASPGDPIERSDETINRLKSRTGVVTESELERLVNRGDLTLGEFDVLVSITVVCQECGMSQDVSELLSDGSCYCDDPSPE